MPNIKNITKTINNQGIPFDFPRPGEGTDVFALIEQMDKQLTPEQRLSVMQEQGCCKTDFMTAPFRAFGQAHANKTLEEKITLLPELNAVTNVPCHLNTDGTLTIYWGFEKDGKYRCLCRTINRMPEQKPISLTFCGCCAGHMRHTYQYALGVKLKLKGIISSPISSDRKNRCEFLFEIMDD